MTTYTLKTPVEHNGKKYETITFREPKTGDLMVMDKFTGETSKMIALLSAISDVPIPAFKEISMSDFAALSEVAAPLLGNSPVSTADGSTS